MEAFAAYIPMDRRQALALGEVLPDRTQGAALFADISGFTPLTEALAQELGRRRGAEELTRQLNLVYDALIAEVDRYGGSVLGFSGDAITCWFDRDDGRRATACGLAMQQAMKQFAAITTPAGGTVSLAMKAAVAVGPARRFVVGDPAIQLIDVLAGATLGRVAAAEHLAGKGEVVLDSEAGQRLGEWVRIAEWRRDEETGEYFGVVERLRAPVTTSPWPPLAHDGLPEARLRSWLLPPVYERLRSGQGEFLADLRPAVALFLSFSGVDYDDDETAGEKLDVYIRWVQGILGRYEGFLLQLTIGDKGSYLYAAFGAPLAHDDDAHRAVAAALELRSPPETLDFIRSVQIGISQGRMRAGAYGGTTRRTYGVLGDEVNLAARLMGKAEPGQVLVSQRVADGVARSYALDFIGPISVKGKQEPVLVSSVLTRRLQSPDRSATLFKNPLVGREEELAQIVQMLDAALEGKGHILRIEGTEGIGKSRLAAEMVQRALDRGMRVAHGTCQSTTHTTAYTPWRQAFRAVLRMTEEPAAGEDPAALIARQIAEIETLVRQANPDWLMRLPLLGDLLGLPIPDNATTAAFDPRLRREALFALVVDLVQYWAQVYPLLILIEDVHWMDEASLGLTLALARAITSLPVVLALVHRPPLRDADRPLPELDRLPFAEHLLLGELSPQGVAALVAHRLQGQPSPLVLSLIQARAQGNPFFIEELLDTLREAGNLYRIEDGRWFLAGWMFEALRQAHGLVKTEGRWTLAPDAPLSSVQLGLPDSIHGIVLSRIDRLPEAHKLSLKVAGVIGRTFSFDVLAHAHPLHASPRALLDQIEMLEERDFTLRETPPPTLTYCFKHNVTHQVAYETLLFTQRQQLHRAVGEVLEQLFPDAVAQIAYHAFLGQDWPRALRYQLLTGQHAQRLFANHEAIEHFRKALQSAENLAREETADQRQMIHAALGELLTSTGQYEPALEHLHQALALAVTLGDCDAQVRACRWLARLHELRGEYPPALDWIQRGLEALGTRETADAAELLAIAGLIQTRQGNYEHALEQGQRSLRIAARLGEKTVQGRASNLLGHITLLRGNSSGAIEFFHQALDLYEQAENIHGQALAHNHIANAYFYRGQWPEADHHYRRAREIFSQIGDVYNRVIADNNLGGIARNQGRLDEALGFYRAGLRSLEQIGGSLWVLGVFHMNLGATFIRCGQIDTALQHLHTSQDSFSQAQARDFLPEMHRLFAEAALLAGDLSTASAQGRQALSLARELSMRAEEGNSLRVLGEIASARGEAGEAERRLGESLAVLEAVGDEYELARSQLSLACVFLMQGKREQGLEMLERCTAIFRQLDATLDLAVATALREEGGT